MNLQGEFFGKGYNTGVVDTDEHRDAPHDAGPLPLEFVRLSQMAVEAGVQQADNSCEKEEANRPKLHKISRNSGKRQRANPVMELLCVGLFYLQNMCFHNWRLISGTCVHLN